MQLPRITALACLLFCTVSCASEDRWRDTPVGFGNRLRIAIKGREIPSILTEDHFAYFVIDRPGEAPLPVNILILATGGSGGAALVAKTVIKNASGVGELTLVESEPSSDLIEDQAHDVRLPEGWHLSLRAGDTYVYRVVDGKMVTDGKVELQLAAIDENERGYVTAVPTPSQPLPRAEAPTAWPAER